MMLRSALHRVYDSLEAPQYDARASSLTLMAQTLAQLLASLSEEERVILTLHYLRSLSSEEIAVMLRVPEAAVIGVIVTGRARLTSALEI